MRLHVLYRVWQVDSFALPDGRAKSIQLNADSENPIDVRDNQGGDR